MKLFKNILLVIVALGMISTSLLLYFLVWFYFPSGLPKVLTFSFLITFDATMIFVFVALLPEFIDFWT